MKQQRERTKAAFQNSPAQVQLRCALIAKAEYERQVREAGLPLDPELLKTVESGIARLRKQLGITAPN